MWNTQVLTTSLKALMGNTITLGIGFQNMKSGGHQHSDHSSTHVVLGSKCFLNFMCTLVSETEAQDKNWTGAEYRVCVASFPWWWSEVHMGIRLIPVERVFGTRETAFTELDVLFLTGKFWSKWLLSRVRGFGIVGTASSCEQNTQKNLEEGRLT